MTNWEQLVRKELETHAEHGDKIATVTDDRDDKFVIELKPSDSIQDEGEFFGNGKSRLETGRLRLTAIGAKADSQGRLKSLTLAVDVV